MSRAIRELANEERKKSMFLKHAEKECEDFEKSQELRKEQTKSFYKYHFLRKLNAALEKK